jgi:hypothetical protein
MVLPVREEQHALITCERDERYLCLAFQLAAAALPSRTADRALQHTLLWLDAAAIMNKNILYCLRNVRTPI